MSLCFPYFLMEPIVDKLSSQQWFASTSRKRDEDERECIVSSLGSVRIPLSLELGHTVLSLADVYALEPGDVIKLDETRKSEHIDAWTRNKAYQKMRESRRFTPEEQEIILKNKQVI